MVWNPSSEVAVARAAANKLEARGAVIVYIKDGKLGMASYGQTKSLCAEMGRLGDKLFDAGMAHFKEIAP